MIGVAGGLALTGLRPIAHSYAPFLVDRAYEQIKLDLEHQGVGAILVSVGASYDGSSSGRTHQSPGDVALFDTLGDGWTVHVPGHPDEVGPILRQAAGHDGRVYVRLSTRTNGEPRPTGPHLAPLRRGERAAGGGGRADAGPGARGDGRSGRDRGLHQHPAPVRHAGGCGPSGTTRSSWSSRTWPVRRRGSSTRPSADRPHRTLHLGVGARDARRYGTPEDHDEHHGLDVAGLRRSISAFLAS